MIVGPDDQRRLLSLARRALEARVRREPAPPFECGGALDEICDAFVSVHRGEDLRGCLGQLRTDWPLARVVVHLAAVVADSDPRFVPITVAELEAVAIEISVLTPPREIRALEEIAVGRHGLVVELGSRQGLLLPQVPLVQGWDRLAFAEHVCRKAGLPKDAWRTGAQLFVFEAEVFAEHG